MAVPRALAVVTAATVLVAGVGLSAQASGGRWLLLGAHNDARRTTTLEKHGRGAALQLQTRRGSPLAVSSGRRVPRLNADRLDGLHAESLRTRAYVYRAGTDEDWGPDLTKVFPELPRGMYLATYVMTDKLYSSGPFACWFTTPTQSKAGYSKAYTTEDYDKTTITASALLDGRGGPIKLHCGPSSAGDTVATEDERDSRVTFLRVAPTHTRWATTVDP